MPALPFKLNQARRRHIPEQKRKVTNWRDYDESLRQRGARIMGAGALPPTPSGSGEADVLRASQVQHAIEHVDGDVHFGRPTLIRMRAQPVADHLLPSANGGLGPGAFRVPGRPLPGPAAPLGDELEMAVALRRRTLGRLAQHGGRARRHDHLRLGVALGDAGVNTILVVSAIAREGGYRPRHLVEQGTGFGAVIPVGGGQRRGDELTRVGVHAQGACWAGSARLGPVFLDQPFAGPAGSDERELWLDGWKEACGPEPEGNPRVE